MTPPAASVPVPDGEQLVQAISPRLRTRVYVICLVLDVTTSLGLGLAGVFGWLPGEQAAAAAVLMIAAINAVAAGLGVAYRPTRPALVPLALPASFGALAGLRGRIWPPRQPPPPPH